MTTFQQDLIKKYIFKGEDSRFYHFAQKKEPFGRKFLQKALKN
jgi:hypothetical protein